MCVFESSLQPGQSSLEDFTCKKERLRGNERLLDQTIVEWSGGAEHDQGLS